MKIIKRLAPPIPATLNHRPSRPGTRERLIAEGAQLTIPTPAKRHQNAPIDPVIAQFTAWHRQQPWYGESIPCVGVDLSRGYLDPDDLYIEGISVAREQKKQGIGRAILAKLIELADEHHLVLALEASEDTPSSDWLQSWYARHGFAYTEDCDHGDWGPYMVRQPKSHD
jgi:GNAT superfamily N-acetyltransferase